MKTYALALILFGFFTVDAASQPYGNEGNISITNPTQQSETSENADIEEGSGSVFFPPSSDSGSQREESLTPHTAIDMNVAVQSKDDKYIANSVSSMKSFSQINPSGYFDRDKYLKERVEEMMSDEKRYRSAERVCRWCNASWMAIGGISTTASFIISTLGTAGYIDPKFSNVLSVVLGIFSGGCLWAANQTKNASQEYHDEVSTLQKSLGVPDKWLASEVNLNLEPFKAATSQRGGAVLTP